MLATSCLLAEIIIIEPCLSVDKTPEFIPGSAPSVDGAVFYHVEASCTGLPCAPYDPQKQWCSEGRA